MKLENFKPHPMREVEYYGVKINIPADHEWVATCIDGSIHSFKYEPYYEWQEWVPHEAKPFVIYVVGRCMAISERDAANSLQYYPAANEFGEQS